MMAQVDHGSGSKFCFVPAIPGRGADQLGLDCEKERGRHEKDFISLSIHSISQRTTIHARFPNLKKLERREAEPQGQESSKDEQTQQSTS